MDLIALGDVGDRCVDELLPVFKVGIAQPLRVLTGEGDDRRPHISRMLCHLPYRLREIFYLTVGIPQPVLAVLSANTVCFQSFS